MKTSDHVLTTPSSPAIRIQEERIMHEAKLAKMETEMKLVFQQKVQEKEAKLKQSEEELYARHREMKEALEKQRLDLEDKKRRIESGRPLTPEKSSVCPSSYRLSVLYSDKPLLCRPAGRRTSCAAKGFFGMYLVAFWFRLLCLSGVALLSLLYSAVLLRCTTVHHRFL